MIPRPPADALEWAYWFLEPAEMHEGGPNTRAPNSGPYMNYLTLAQFLVDLDRTIHNNNNRENNND